ncbi:hypothetical protein CJ030_MR2G014091 [Morella rubra]|uniref:BHLH domain-containing protein n=1 Tax=Morella rubra TaxID=262757 RepID=A0A6A1VE31_9ROSI|nr:hypothetical protein CJ030_MR6G019824 [Morella rubra]KAB1222844.1 hypothetical protein CJ030_MR2G014091 [Morella rubra]
MSWPVFQISSNTHSGLAIRRDLILPDASMDDSIINFDEGRARRKKSTAISSNCERSDDNDKKMMHRDMERRRRKDMAELHRSLRSLLPLEYIKGKRAISDHMKEAVTYIKHLQNKMKELSAERDKLKELSTSNIALEPESGTSTASPASCVLVRPCSGGVEIMVNSSLKEQGLPLSRALQVLLEKGLAVYSCVSSKVDERLIYTIQAEVGDLTCVDLPGLQEKLSAAIP